MSNFTDKINLFLAKVVTGDLSREEGQGAFEYIIILAVLGVVVYEVFSLLGISLLDQAQKFINNVFP